MSEYKWKESFVAAMENFVAPLRYKNRDDEADKAFDELDEVYRKAEAFDRVVESYDYFDGYKVKDLQNIGMDVLGIVGKYRQGEDSK